MCREPHNMNRTESLGLELGLHLTKKVFDNSMEVGHRSDFIRAAEQSFVWQGGRWQRPRVTNTLESGCKAVVVVVVRLERVQELSFYGGSSGLEEAFRRGFRSQYTRKWRRLFDPRICGAGD